MKRSPTLTLRRLKLPDFAEDLAANTFATSLTTGHYTLGGSHDGNTEATLDTANFIATKIYTATGTRDALQVANDGFVVRAVLEINADDLLPVFFRRLVVRDIALFFEDAGNLGLEL